MELRNNKHCPRCDTKMPFTAVICPRCELNFNKFNQATNYEAKQAFKQGDRERIVMRKGCPKDVSKAKLLLLSIFLGFCGAHHYYIGRYKMGVLYTSAFIIGILNAIIEVTFEVAPSGDLWQVFYCLVLVWGCVLIMWIIDIVKIIFNRFKIPVSLSR